MKKINRLLVIMAITVLGQMTPVISQTNLSQNRTDAIHYVCTHKRAEFNDWVAVQPEVHIDIYTQDSVIFVKEQENTLLTIKYEKDFIGPGHERYFSYGPKVVMIIPKKNDRLIISVYSDNFLCPQHGF